jgi:CubicO group peptidase (beta-lactamase class C family)
MKSVVILVFTFIFIAPSIYAQGGNLHDSIPTSNPLSTSLDKKVDAIARQYMVRVGVVGMSIGVLINGKAVFYGYGETEKGNRQLPNEHTIFGIGSITKTFTGTLLACAVLDGKINLDDPVNKYMPDSIPPLEYQGIPVTIRTMANHTSGIPRMPSNLNPKDTLNPFRDYDDNDLFSFYKNFKIQRKPGDTYEYSNLAAATLGVILERIYNRSFESLIVEKIANPLGMNDTRQFIKSGDSLRLAKGYGPNYTPVPEWEYKSLAGSGSILSTVADLLKFAAANMSGAPSGLNEAMQLTHQQIFKDGADGVGMLWDVIGLHHEIIDHNGRVGGFTSFLIIDLKRLVAVVLLSNTAILTFKDISSAAKAGMDREGYEIMKFAENHKE